MCSFSEFFPPCDGHSSHRTVAGNGRGQRTATHPLFRLRAKRRDQQPVAAALGLPGTTAAPGAETETQGQIDEVGPTAICKVRRQTFVDGYSMVFRSKI